MTEIRNSVNDLRSDMNEVKILLAKAQNISATEPRHVLVPIRTADGQVPGGFPATVRDLHHLSDDAVVSLLAAYGVDVPEESAEERIDALSMHIGCRFSFYDYYEK
jgi:hypothetical protein